MSTKQSKDICELTPDDLEMVVGGSAPAPMGLGGSFMPAVTTQPARVDHHFAGMPCGIGGSMPSHHDNHDIPPTDPIVASGARDAFVPIDALDHESVGAPAVADQGGPMGLGGDS